MEDENVELKTKSIIPWAAGKLATELASVTQEELDLIEMGLEVPKKREKVVGQLDLETKQFIALIDRVDKKIADLEKDILKEDGSLARQPTHEEHHQIKELGRKRNVLCNIVTLCIADLAGWDCMDNYAVRSNWQIVEKPYQPSLLDLLGGLVNSMSEMDEDDDEFSDFPSDEFITDKDSE